MTQLYTFGFVDLAGFTALTEVHGDQVAADQVQRLTTLAREAMTGSTAVVKVVGDAALLAGEDVEAVVSSAHALLLACNGEPDFPLARCGLHTGSAVRQGADFFGSGVNLAARVTARAAGGELVVTQTPAEAARGMGFAVHAIGPVVLRNVAESVELFKIDVCGHDSAIDPVCRMTVDRANASGVLTHNDLKYWFCSLRCAGTFAQDPQRYLAPCNADVEDEQIKR